MSSVLTAAELHALNNGASEFSMMLFGQRRIRLKDAADLHVGAALTRLGVNVRDGHARGREICGCVYCLLHDTFRGPSVRLSLNENRTDEYRLSVPEKYVTGDTFGEALKTKTHRRASGEKTANHDARGRAAPLIPTMALVPSGAGEVAQAQVNVGRIVGRSGTSDS